MEIIISLYPGMDSPSGFYKAESMPQTVSHTEVPGDILKKLDQVTSESPWKTFLNDLMNGNTEGQLQYLSSQYERTKRSRTYTGGQVPSRNRFLSTLKDSLKNHELRVSKEVCLLFLHTPQYNSNATS